MLGSIVLAGVLSFGLSPGYEQGIKNFRIPMISKPYLNPAVSL